MKLLILSLALLTSFTVAACGKAQIIDVNQLEAKYVANAGVKLISGDKVTLIDALFGQHKRFRSLTEAEFAELASQGANLTLTTHAHSDHFHPKQTTQFLQQNNNTLFIGTPQSKKHLKELDGSNQLLVPELTGYEAQQVSHDGIQVSVLSFPHMEPQKSTQNYAYLVEVNGWKILHVGDADINEQVLKAHNIAERNIDLLLIHDLFPVVAKDYQALLTQINAKQVAFVHIMDSRVKPFKKWLDENLPEATMLATGYGDVKLIR